MDLYKHLFNSWHYVVRSLPYFFILYATLSIGSVAAHPKESVLKAVLDRGHLIVGVRSTTPGFGFKNERGELDGFDIDLARALANGLFDSPDKIKFEILPSGRERIPALLSGRVDMVVSQFSVLQKRAQVVGFSLPYCNADFSAIVRADSPYKKNADLNGKVVTTRQGAELDKIILKAIPQAKIQSYPNLSDAFLAFRQGRAEAFFNDNVAGLVIAAREPGKYRVINDLDNPLNANQFSIGVRQDDTVWLSYVNWALTRLALTGVLGDIHEKWLKTQELMPKWARTPH
ncbi:hypothetical protein AB833_02130 [Chromatiales bacterium (ex Bugula neritina AB1)]|nr:hypothetical protein AB833_02130 [Chromatiales bacterium (ex Bugula neritina AB1)]